MKGKIGWGSSFFRQGDALQTRPVLGVAARSTDREPSSFLDKQVGWFACILPTSFQGLQCAPEVLRPCARDRDSASRPEQTRAHILSLQCLQSPLSPL